MTRTGQVSSTTLSALTTLPSASERKIIKSHRVLLIRIIYNKTNIRTTYLQCMKPRDHKKLTNYCSSLILPCIVRVPRVGAPLHQGLLGFWLFSEAGRRNITCSVICPLHYQSTWLVLTNRSEVHHCREFCQETHFFIFNNFVESSKSTVSGASFTKPFSCF